MTVMGFMTAAQVRHMEQRMEDAKYIEYCRRSLVKNYYYTPDEVMFMTADEAHNELFTIECTEDRDLDY